MSFSYTRKNEWFLSHGNVRRETKEHMHIKQNLAKNVDLINCIILNALVLEEPHEGEAQ